MRIIAGEFRRRLLHAPPGMHTRPIPDRVKESVFALLGARTVGATFLDLFSGSGAIGLEAVSRGAKLALLVDNDANSEATMRKNVDMLKCPDRAQVIKGDALGLAIVARAPRPLDLVFLDPPYPLIQGPLGWDRVRAQCTALASILAPDGFLILRTPWPHAIDPKHDSSGPGVVTNIKDRKKKPKPKPRHKDWKETFDGNADRGAPRSSQAKRSPAGPPASNSPFSLGRGQHGSDKHGLGKNSSGKKSGSKPDFSLEDFDMLDDQPDEFTGHEELIGGLLADHAPTSKRKPREGDYSHPREDEEPDELDLQELESEFELASAALQRVRADPTIPGLRGPETHEYGSTAVHFYMRI